MAGQRRLSNREKSVYTRKDARGSLSKFQAKFCSSYSEVAYRRQDYAHQSPRYSTKIGDDKERKECFDEDEAGACIMVDR